MDDIMKYAKAIKKYCEECGQDCIGCMFEHEDNSPYCCMLYNCPSDWDLKNKNKYNCYLNTGVRMVVYATDFDRAYKEILNLIKDGDGTIKVQSIILVEDTEE